MKYYFLVLVMGLSWACSAQKKSKETTALKFYEGPERDNSELVILKCQQEKKLSLFFQSIDGKAIPIQENGENVSHILIAPGEHSVKLRFMPKKKVPTSAETFDKVDFAKGGTYLIKSEYTPGTGDYPTSAFTARLRLWIEKDSKVLTEQVVDGMGEKASKD